MISSLYVNGCSWTEGFLLEEEPHVLSFANNLGYEIVQLRNAKKNGETILFPIFEIYNNFNWAGKVARELNIPRVINHAEGGGSNARIVRTTVNYIRGLTDEEKSQILVVIGWTLPDRSELFLDDKHGTAQWALFNATQPFETLMPSDIYEEEFFKRISKYWENYVVDVHNTYACIYDFFQQSELLANFLENQGIKYYFFNTFPLFWKWNDMNKEQLEELFTLANNYNSKYSFLPTNDTFCEFINNRKELELSDGHPNSLAYELWGQHLVDNIRLKNIL